MTDFVLKGTFVSAPGPDKLEIAAHTHLVVRNGRAAGFTKEYDGDLPVEDYGDSIILPGFADMHVHAPQYAMRGMGMDMELLPWLETYTFPEESKFADAAYAKEVYARFVDALVKSGTTRACVFGTIHTDTVLMLMDMLERAGISAFVGKVNMDRNAPEALCEDAESSLRETRRWLEACEGRYDHVRPILTPRFIPSCTDGLLAALGKLAETGLSVQSHLSENRAEGAWVKELVPDACCYGGAYDKFGLFGQTKTVMAHCVHCPPEEMALMAERGVFAAHCPDSNSNLASGMADVRALLQAGVRVTLGSDIAGGCSVSILDAMAKAVCTSKQRFALGGGSPLTVTEALYMGTSAGAAFFGEEAGFAAGVPLHAVVLNDAALLNTQKLSVLERLERMIYLYEDRKIDAVYANGRKIMEKGESIK